MAEMPFALRATDLGTKHTVAGVPMLGHMFIDGRRSETGPATARIIFGVACEQQLATARAAVMALVVIVPILSGERTLRARFAQHMILHRVQAITPLGLAELQFLFLWHGRDVGTPRRDVKARPRGSAHGKLVGQKKVRL